MSTLELLQLQNEHKDNFFGKGEDCALRKEKVKELENSRKQFDDIISEAKLENSLELIQRINSGLEKIGVEAKIVFNPFETSATIYHTYANNKCVDREKPQYTIPLHYIIR